MSMLKNHEDYEYAGALKEAIAMRRAGTIDMRTDDMLGHCLYSIAQWAISDYVRTGRLVPDTAHDIDFQALVVLKVAEAVNRVDLSREPNEILAYLKNAAEQEGIKNQLRYMGAKKRNAATVRTMDCEIVADIYGHMVAGKVSTNTQQQGAEDAVHGRDHRGREEGRDGSRRAGEEGTRAAAGTGKGTGTSEGARAGEGTRKGAGARPAA